MFRKIDQARALVNCTLKTWEEEERKNRLTFEAVAEIDRLFSEIVIMLRISNPSPSFWPEFQAKLRKLSALVYIAEFHMGYVSVAPI